MVSVTAAEAGAGETDGPATGEFPAGRSPGRRVRRLALLTVAGACLAVGSGLAGASLVKSPAEVAAETAAPPPSVITAPVMKEVLSESIVLRGTFGVSSTLSFTPSSVASTAANAGGDGMVVTGMYVKPGDQVHSGEVVAEVSDRPVFVLQGPLPLWRDLVPGESGKDVGELQAALAGLGYSSGADQYGYFGTGTEAAVEAFYQGIGYAPPVESAVGGSGKSASGSAGSGSSGGGKASQSAAAPPVIVPMSEAWFVPRLPAEVMTVPAQVGAVSPTSLLTIAQGALQLTGQLDPSEESLVKAGMPVSVYADVTGYTGAGTISSVGTAVVQPSDGSAGYVPVGVRPDASWPTSLNGQNVQITITAATTGRPVLAVPVAAVSYDASGQAEVIVSGPGDARRRVFVRAGLSAGGYVGVSASSAPGLLRPGTLVVVGQ
jgi:peptidoglycan hydrolase-like protein with peptidoglycan-binding domain